MPTYLYECEDCKESFSAVHSIKVKQESCILCTSKNLTKLVTSFAAKTETSKEAVDRRLEEQCKQDVKRMQKDDKFLANITGADDAKSEERKNKVAADNIAYIRSKQEELKKEGKLHPQQIKKKDS